MCRSMIAAIALAASALVMPAFGGPLDRELPPDGTACWSRAYDSSHFVQHPRQRVAAIALSKQAIGPERGVFALILKINLRDRTKPNEGEVRHYDYSHVTFCKAAGNMLACENEYGLGKFRVERARGGLIIRNPGTILFNPSNYDSEDISDDVVKLRAQPDDAAWLLDTRGSNECPF